MNTAAIGVGSNIEPVENIEKAEKYISSDHSLIKSSSFIKTEPLGFKDQNDFLNGAFLVKTKLSKNEFIKYLKSVEDKLGRVRTDNKNGPRTIDLDVLIWNGDIQDEDCLRRDFLRKCLNELGYKLNSG